MQYVYLLDENNICVGINNFYNNEQLQNIIRNNNLVKHIVMDEYKAVLGYRYDDVKSEFVNVEIPKSTLSMNEIAMSQILLDLAKIKEKLEVI